MEDIVIKSVIKVCNREELSENERKLIDSAIESTNNSYSPYSHFSVGAAALLDDDNIVPGCNQENAAFGVTICAERSALFAAGAMHPEKKVVAIAIAARAENGNLLEQPVTPCGSCRQALLEYEILAKNDIKVILVGCDEIYVLKSIKSLLPLAFSEF